MKKMFFSLFAFIALTAYAFAENAEKEIYLSHEIQNNTEDIISDIVVGTCSGTFNFYDPVTRELKYILRKSESTASEQDCFDWIATHTLYLADRNPGFDITGSGAYAPF